MSTTVNLYFVKISAYPHYDGAEDAMTGARPCRGESRSAPSLEVTGCRTAELSRHALKCQNRIPVMLVAPSLGNSNHRDGDPQSGLQNLHWAKL